MKQKKPTKLFEPIMVGNMQRRNRIKMPAMAIAVGEDGGMSEAAKAFSVERAKGGVALMGVSCTATHAQPGLINFLPGD